MSVFNSLPPKINKNDLIKWLKKNYQFLNNKPIKLKSLNSERDKNYILDINTSQKYVIKISNPKETLNLLNLQDYVLKNLNKRPSLKKYIPKKIHKKIKYYLNN